MKKTRQVMSLEKTNLLSHEIFENLIKLDKYIDATNIFTYISIREEVRTEELINYSLLKGKKVFAPKVMSGKTMNFYSLDSLNNLKKGAFSIYEPAESGDPVLPSDKDILIVPGLAFDLKKNRLGYGGGYYDRFINELIKKPTIIALCYDFQIVENVPSQIHDIPMNIIITDKRIIF